MKAKEVFKLTGISHKHRSRLVNKGTISFYCHLNIIYAQVFAPTKQGVAIDYVFSDIANGINFEIRYLISTNRTAFFLGKRIKLGLYRSQDRILINADVNGAYNILRKCNPKFSFFD